MREAGMIEPSDTTNACPRCGRSKAPDTIGHRHTGAQCFWCGFSTDRDEAEIAGSGEAEGKAMSEKSETTDILDRLRRGRSMTAKLMVPTRNW